ncbi:MAG: DUF2520 domain-containing protein [Cyclobacteriaceae bacterium]|nr:DUF2520 domain-containing protein [Cyclobacteriaceae bacterium]MDH4298020.1 DUF2520 domain-containing protein [Cyclobacteriaceae bacterium]
MTKAMFVSFIGSGNLAWHLAPALDNAGFSVQEVYSRNPTHAEALVERLYDAEVKVTLDFSTSTSTVFVVATPDDSIQGIAKEIILPEDAVLVHTSGSQLLSVLDFAATRNLGVFYPLQTFSKGRKVEFNEIPVFVECENKTVEDVLMAMARGISKSVYKIAYDERKALHVAAVFAANFTNHMLLLAQEIMKENSLSYDWLKPLIAEMITKSLAIGPENAQTGPARRGDLETLDRHLEFLQNNESIGELYKIISQDIVDRYTDTI